VLTVVVDHDLDIAEDLAVPPVSLVAGLGDAAQTLPVDWAVGLRVQHKGHGQQSLDPFYVLSAVFGASEGRADRGEVPMNWSRR
jgi:hypothetical protein